MHDLQYYANGDEIKDVDVIGLGTWHAWWRRHVYVFLYVNMKDTTGKNYGWGEYSDKMDRKEIE
jgi:hypothetical protein